RDFAKADIPHNSRSIWWRLLHDKLPHRARMHTWSPLKYPSPLCSLCKDTIEGDFHLIIDCRLKRTVWLRALQELAFVHRFPSRRQVWSFLLLAETDSSKRVQFRTLAIPIGLILAAIWRHHWQCVIEDRKWSVDVYLSSIRNQRFALGLNFQDFDCLV
ncbi:hypothetical protein BGW37DRAFT_431180, partial [Umbelopsis sp. PMI_123]